METKTPNYAKMVEDFLSAYEKTPEEMALIVSTVTNVLLCKHSFSSSSSSIEGEERRDEEEKERRRIERMILKKEDNFLWLWKTEEKEEEEEGDDWKELGPEVDWQFSDGQEKDKIILKWRSKAFSRLQKDKKRLGNIITKKTITSKGVLNYNKTLRLKLVCKIGGEEQETETIYECKFNKPIAVRTSDRRGGIWGGDEDELLSTIFYRKDEMKGSVKIGYGMINKICLISEIHYLPPEDDVNSVLKKYLQTQNLNRLRYNALMNCIIEFIHAVRDIGTISSELKLICQSQPSDPDKWRNEFFKALKNKQENKSKEKNQEEKEGEENMEGERSKKKGKGEANKKKQRKSSVSKVLNVTNTGEEEEDSVLQKRKGKDDPKTTANKVKKTANSSVKDIIYKAQQQRLTEKGKQ